MAFNLLVELNGNKANWKVLNESLNKLARDYIEFFPIPNSVVDSKNYIGVSVVNNNINAIKIEALKKTINFLLKEKHKIFEFYNSNEFFESNIDSLINEFFKPI